MYLNQSRDRWLGLPLGSECRHWRRNNLGLNRRNEGGALAECTLNANRTVEG